MEVRQVTMRRCLVKLITGIGADREKNTNESAKNQQYLKEMSLVMMYCMHA